MVPGRLYWCLAVIPSLGIPEFVLSNAGGLFRISTEASLGYNLT